MAAPVTVLRRLALASAVVLVGSLFPPRTLAFQVPVIPKIDHAAKTITFEGKLFLYPDRGCKYFFCMVTDEIVQAAKADIEAVWNGYKFRCYRVVIKANVSRGKEFEIPADAVAVKIDRTTEGLRSEVSTEGAGSWNSSDPSARKAPTNEGSTWSVNQDSRTLHAHSYAHEFGHVLGLDDGYIEINGVTQDRPGAPHDIMSTGQDDDSGVSQETIDRLVHRAGIKDDDVRCDLGWEVRIEWTDSYDGVLDTMTFDGVVDTVPLGDEFVGISLIGRGTVSGSRSGWKACNPGIDVTPNGTVSATFLAILQDDMLTVSAYADFDTVLSGISTAPFEFDATVETEQTLTIVPSSPVGEPCPYTSYGTAKVKPIKPTPS